MNLIILSIFFISSSVIFCEDILLTQKDRHYDFANHSDTLDSEHHLSIKYYTDKNSVDLYIYLYKGDEIRDMVYVEVGEFIPDRKVKKQKINKSIYPTFIKSIGRTGSTFGAYTHIIVWHDENYWRITKTPFIWAELVDVNKDGIYEFHELYNEDQYDEPRIYSFVNGGFIPFKSK